MSPSRHEGLHAQYEPGTGLKLSRPRTSHRGWT